MFVASGDLSDDSPAAPQADVFVTDSARTLPFPRKGRNGKETSQRHDNRPRPHHTRVSAAVTLKRLSQMAEAKNISLSAMFVASGDLADASTAADPRADAFVTDIARTSPPQGRVATGRRPRRATKLRPHCISQALRHANRHSQTTPATDRVSQTDANAPPPPTANKKCFLLKVAIPIIIFIVASAIVKK